MTYGLTRKVDCVSAPVANIGEAIAFHRDRLGHELVWWSETAAGLRMPESKTEFVAHTEPQPATAELLVESVATAVERFVDAGGALVSGPFETQIGRGALVSDPWGNTLMFLDMSTGPPVTDSDGNVVR